jgi:hypothetical protein
VGARRRRRAAGALGIRPEDKVHLDAMHERSLARFGVGIGVLVQQEKQLTVEAASHRVQRAQLPWRARLWFPFGNWHRLRRMEAEATARAEEWGRRLRIVALDVAAERDEPVDPAVARMAEGR